MARVKKLLRGTLSLRSKTTQISKIYAMIKTLHKLTGLGMPKTKAIF
ncbi:Mobile element protein [Candidatus Enterovibrio altilux]|uniref:Mobile element protein n=1 Tax=Candidatus Enterovibrio altilux TaxID=1927128 RepID=A0A291B9S0_9GAMM|nr:Mobile element protein [Candidatus Enterovibrio luxaltus]